MPLDNERSIVQHSVQLKEVFAEKVHGVRHSFIPGQALSAELAVKSQGEAWSKDEGHSDVKLNVTGRQGEKVAVEIEVVVRGIFRSREGGDQESFDAFLKTQGLALLWPFMRELVANLTTRLGLPPLLIPLIHVFQTATDIATNMVEHASPSTGNGDV